MEIGVLSHIWPKFTFPRLGVDLKGLARSWLHFLSPGASLYFHYFFITMRLWPGEGGTPIYELTGRTALKGILRQSLAGYLFTTFKKNSPSD